MQNYGPDQSQGQFWVTVCDVVIPDIYKFDLMTGNVINTHIFTATTKAALKSLNDIYHHICVVYSTIDVNVNWTFV